MKVLRVQDLAKEEQLYWSWVQEQSPFTRLVVMELLLSIQDLREGKIPSIIN